MTAQDWVALGLVVLVIIAFLSPPSGPHPPPHGRSPFDPWGYQ